MILVYCEVDTTDNDCRGNEPVYDGEELIGLTTSGTWGHTTGRGLAFAYVKPQYKASGTRFEVQLMSDRRPAMVLDGPAYDPNNEKPRA